MSNFAKLISSTTITNIGDGIRSVALPLLATVLTRDALLIAAVTAAGRLPWLLMSLPVGVLVDRYDRRVLMVCGSLAQALFIGTVAAAEALKLATIWLLLVVAFLMGCLEVIIDNTAQVITPSVVPDDRLETANGRLAGAYIIANEFAGPPAGGVLFVVSRFLPFVVDSLSFVLSAACLTWMRGRFAASPAPSRGEDGGVWPQMTAGLRWLRRDRQLSILMLTSAAQNLFANAGIAVMVIYTLRVLHLNGFGFGVLTAIGAAGGLVASLLGARVGRFGQIGFLLTAANLLMALAALGLGLTVSPVIAGCMLVINGFAVVVWNVVTVTIRQRRIPGELMGRVNSAYRMIAWAGIPLGAVVGGIVTHHWGAQAPFLIEGVALVIVSVILFCTRSIGLPAHAVV